MSTILERAEASTEPGWGTCEAVWSFLGIEAPCVAPAIGRYRRICVHEHVRDGLLCQEHVNRTADGLCLTCQELKGELSHECPISITEVSP